MDIPRKIYFHNSPREIRILQGVEYIDPNKPYMCTTCRKYHLARPELGLNVCVSDSKLHNIHTPRDTTVRCPADPIHVDWVTVCGATIPDLEFVWHVDYEKQRRPMRILLCAGLNDLARGKSRTDIVASILHFKQTVEKQNAFHPHTKNELVVATILNPPKFVWFPENPGTPPPNYTNRLAEIKELNSWITYFNQQNNKFTPRLHRLGIKNGTKKDKDGKKVRVLHHLFQQWRQSEPRFDMMHLSDEWRVRMGSHVVRHFQGELERHGVLGSPPQAT